MASWWLRRGRWVVVGIIAGASLGFAQTEQDAPRADAPATQPSESWKLIEQIMAAPETAAEKRDELRKLRELARAVLGEDVTPEQLVKSAEPALLHWLQIDEAVALPPGVPAHEDGAWSGIDPRLREATRWLLWSEAQPDYLAVFAAPVLLDWLSDRFSRRLAKHYMRLENLTLESDVYLALERGDEPKLEMPETLPKVFSVRMWNQPHRSRAEVTVEGEFVWGVISERREDGWYLTEWTPTKREGPYRFRVEYQHRDSLRLLPAIGPAHLPVACNMGAYALPMIGGDMVTSTTMVLGRFRQMTRSGRDLLGRTVEYDGMADSITGERCHRFTSCIADVYVGHLYVCQHREALHACQMDGAQVAGMPKYALGTGYGRITFRAFSTDRIDDARFVPPDVPNPSE